MNDRILAALLGNQPLLQMAKAEHDYARPPAVGAIKPRLHGVGPGFTSEMRVPPDWSIIEDWPGRRPVTGPNFNLPYKPWQAPFDLLNEPQEP